MFGVVGRLSAGGGFIGAGGTSDCCSIEVGIVLSVTINYLYTVCISIVLSIGLT